MITRDGIEVLPHTLPPDRVADLKLEGQRLAMCRFDHTPYPDNIARAHVTENGWRINVTPSRVKRKDAGAQIRIARQVVAGVTRIADSYLGPKWGVSSYIWDYSGPTKENQFPHHVDTFYGFKALKVYVFLTDCGALNGALEYAPGLHHNIRMLMKYPPKDSPPTLEEDNSFANVERLYGYRLQRPSNLNGPAGTVVLFDPAGPHGSGPVRHGERYIFRAHLVERAYVLRHLPDQLPWYLKPVNKVMGWTKKIQAS